MPDRDTEHGLPNERGEITVHMPTTEVVVDGSSRIRMGDSGRPSGAKSYVDAMRKVGTAQDLADAVAAMMLQGSRYKQGTNVVREHDHSDTTDDTNTNPNRAPGIGPCAGCSDSNPDLTCAECFTRIMTDYHASIWPLVKAALELTAWDEDEDPMQVMYSKLYEELEVQAAKYRGGLQCRPT